MVRIIASSVELAQNSQSTSLEDDSGFVSSHLLGLACVKLCLSALTTRLLLLVLSITNHPTNKSEGEATISSAQQTTFHSRMNTDASA